MSAKDHRQQTGLKGTLKDWAGDAMRAFGLGGAAATPPPAPVTPPAAPATPSDARPAPTRPITPTGALRPAQTGPLSLIDQTKLPWELDERAAPAPAPSSPLTAAQAERRSKQRLVFIRTWLKTPDAHPIYQDPAQVHLVLSAEREYQAGRLAALRQRLKALSTAPRSIAAARAAPAKVGRAPKAELEAEIQEVESRLEVLHGLLCRLGSAGGAAWPPAAPPG